MLSTLALALVGLVLLAIPHRLAPPALTAPSTATTAPSAAARTTAASAPVGGRPTVNPAASSRLATPARSAPAPALPPHGEGIAGDRAIQEALESAWPADLPATEERELLATGRALLRADATGVGRAQWPHLFSGSGQALAPAFAAGRFRIQAAIARRDGSPDKAVVHLVWAGMDRGGTFTDLRITDWFFTRTTTKGAGTWTPQSRT
ncbi:hypothetical protein [Streptomyces canus]|uniref:hypothetical protein n=1 Tax=Streptomyces canus TaxID=58343 RepID=UPI0022537961|nr:hypothetical protein [Streptomyces canus]MCX4862399.1 hypothetical protein [Streptomyces canus]